VTIHPTWKFICSVLVLQNHILSVCQQDTALKIPPRMKCQGETYDWEGQFSSQNNNFDFYQQDYDSEDDKLDDLLLRNLGVDRSILGSDQETLRKGIGAWLQPIHHSSLDFGAQLKCRAKICQVCEYEGRGEVQSPVNICLTHSARLCTRTHPHVADTGLVKVDDGEPVLDFSRACPNTDLVLLLVGSSFTISIYRRNCGHHMQGLLTKKIND
jgi:hypothetical protein